MSLETGSQIGHYRVERKLGTGGMGAVYLARDTQLDRLVALKLLVSQSDEGRRRLLREARAVAKLDHPGICAVHEVGHDDAAGDFIALQYIEGETLLSRLRRGRLKPDEALSIAGRVAEALAVAHRNGIVHRDLKPANIMLTPAGVPKLLDFGLATHLAGSASAAEALTVTPITDPIGAVGTPSYMSPEQVRNETPDVRSDVFSLGAVVYECLTGRRPFAGQTNAEIMGSVLHVEPATVSSVVPAIGPAYDAFCARLLNKQPAGRFQSAEEVLGAIRALVPSYQFGTGTTSGVAVPPPRPKSRARVWVTAAAVVIAGVTWLAWPRGPVLPVPPAEAVQWFDIGVQAMRDMTYVGARDAFKRATEIFPDYALAYSRLAEALTALDDEGGAKQALVDVSRLVPDRTRLPREEQFRFEAAAESASRRHDGAVEAYKQLAEMSPRDAGRWLDVGRAQEAATKGIDARASYAKARELDPQLAAAQLRWGVLTARAVQQAEEGFAAIDRAIDLYRTAARTEGEAEALLRKGGALNGQRRFTEARPVLERVLQFTEDGRYASQRIRARFELARIAYFDGQYAGAETLARAGIDEATKADLQADAASGLILLGNSYLGSRRYEEASQQYDKAIKLAQARGARRTEVRARLQRASALAALDRPKEALEQALPPLDFFAKAGEARLAEEARSVAAWAKEGLEQYGEAEKLAREGLQWAEQNRDTPLTITSLENLANQFRKTGRFPEALTYRERIADAHRQQKDLSALPLDLVNQAELLILSGRTAAADNLLRELDDAVNAKQPTFLLAQGRIELMHALRASVDGRFADAEKAAARAIGIKTSGTATTLYARVIHEHARAHLGRSSLPAAALAALHTESATSSGRRLLSTWIAQALLARREPALALQVATQALGDAVTLENSEVAWRLYAIAALAARQDPKTGDGDSMAAQSKLFAGKLQTAWAGAAATYFARADLQALRKIIN